MKFTMYHSCIAVFDLEKSIKFYEDALGFEEVRRISADDGSFEIVFMSNKGDTTMLELTWYRDRREPYDLGDNEIHIGLRVDDFQSALAHHKDMDCVCFEKYGHLFYCRSGRLLGRDRPYAINECVSSYFP